MARFGEAANSFNNPDLHKKFGANAAVGAAGERHYATALDRGGISSKYEVHSSLNIPNSSRSRTSYSSDVDIAVANGNTLILIDVKRFAAGFHYWSFFGFPFKNLTPMLKDGKGDDGPKWRLSANMAAAVDRYQQALPGVHVEAMVAFVPTNSKGAMPASVGLLFWPGGIRSFLAGDSIYRLNKLLGTPTPVNPAIRSLLARMTRP